jgi:hypothetical protein
MDIERLNQTQVILLTLLISFVTSIATGIATVSLMENAPTDVTRVISRIVEKPVETFTPGTKEVVIQENTIVVNESESISNAVAKLSPSLVRLYTISGRDKLVFAGIGLIVSADGVVVADSRIVDNDDNYIVRLSNGVDIAAEPSDIATEQGFFRLKATTDAPLPVLTPAVFEAFDDLTLGQTVIAIGGDASTRIAPGVIAELFSGSGNASSRVRTTVDASGLSLGSPLVTLAGAVVGMPEEAGSQVFVSLREQGTE